MVLQWYYNGITARRQVRCENGAAFECKFVLGCLTFITTIQPPYSLLKDGQPSWPLQSIRFVFGCSGYYDHDKGNEIDFRGRQDFQGKIIHPQV